MSVKNILTAYSGQADKQSTLKHSIKLAKLHDAWITGIVSHDGKPVIGERFGGRLPESILQEIQKLDQERLETIKNTFDSFIQESGLSDRSEFIDLEKGEITDLATFARFYDLVVMGPHSKDPNESHISAYPDRVALQSGRPVLFVPNGYESDQLADHALIAWDGKRAAARALGDAMQYLETKPKVTILCVGSKPGPGMDQLQACLTRHGVIPEVLVKSPDQSIAKTILDTADEVNAKLLVMGAYEHSKFAQDIFGGVTTAVMHESRIPVFLSH